MSYVTIHEKYRMKHVQIPKVFFTNERYSKLSSDAKVAYALLMDRHNLSLKNEWIEEETGRIYFLFKQEEIMSLLNIGSKTTWQKIKKQLVDAELLEFKRMGLKQANRMYIKWPEVTDEDIYKIRKAEEEPSNPWGSSEVQKMDFKKYEKCTSRSTKNGLQEVQKMYPNNTDLNNTDSIKTNINNLSISEEQKSFLLKYADEIKPDHLKAYEELDGLIDDKYLLNSKFLDCVQKKNVKNFKSYFKKSLDDARKETPKQLREEKKPEWFGSTDEGKQQMSEEELKRLEESKNEMLNTWNDIKNGSTPEGYNFSDRKVW
ncbi:hypothetical protein NRS6094_04361 [Bacillus subtilis]|uniref:replication initiator protein A n=1 Tax=Bacillus subtilis TaxID=1423 RepID=UPI001B9131CD|nr:replication initiator protein A [Bacillus subtilis]CAF1778464.1 hypothetical protein NRS6094_04361 [Bacillus subtilis]